jgi:hypothetical protein
VGVEDPSTLGLSPAVNSLNVTPEQGVSDAEKETHKTLDQMLHEIPTDEGQNFFDKYNIPNTKGDSSNFLAAPGRVRQLTHWKKTGSAADMQGKTIAAHPRRCKYPLSISQVRVRNLHVDLLIK